MYKKARVSGGLVLLLVSFLTFVISCSSLHDKAQEQMEKENYLAALTIYQKILTKDPKDADAINGLRQAQQGHVSKELLEIRMTRLAGDNQSALDKIRDIVIFEREHSYFPQGVVFSTQKEELEYGYEYFRKKINLKLQKNYPLAADLVLKDYEEVFSGDDFSFRLKGLRRKVYLASQKSCRTLAKESRSDEYYFRTFLFKYCNYLGDSLFAAKLPQKNPSSKKLYSGVQIETNIKNLPDEVSKGIASYFDRGLKRSSWYSPEGKNLLKIVISGEFKEIYTERPVVLSHSYSVSIPYTDYRTVYYYESVPYTTYELRTDPESGRVESVPMTAYRSERRSKQEPYTAYRDEPRTQMYAAQDYRQTLELRVLATADLPKVKVRIVLNEQDEKMGTYHDNQMADIGLYPQKKNTFSPVNWINEQMQNVPQSTAEVLSEQWRSEYCLFNTKSHSQTRFGDQILRCLRNAKEVPDPRLKTLVDGWFKNNLGVNFAKASQSLGL